MKKVKKKPDPPPPEQDNEVDVFDFIEFLGAVGLIAYEGNFTARHVQVTKTLKDAMLLAFLETLALREVQRLEYEEDVYFPLVHFPTWTVWFPHDVKTVKSVLKLSPKHQTRILNNLKELGLIQIKRMERNGVPAVKHIRVNNDKVNNSKAMRKFWSGRQKAHKQTKDDSQPA